MKVVDNFGLVELILTKVVGNIMELVESIL